MPDLSVASAQAQPSPPNLSSQDLTAMSPPNASHPLREDNDGVQWSEQSSFGYSPSKAFTLDPNMNVGPALDSKREFICGSGAAFINICITFPIHKAIFRQQLHGVSSLRALRQLQKDGLRFLYRGLLPPLLQKSTSMSIMFGSYTRCQALLEDIAPSLSTVQNHTLSALTAGTLEAFLTPFERVQTLMQNRQFHDRFSNTLDAFKNLRHYGFAEYYRGLTVVIIRNGPSNVFFFLGREFLETKAPLPHSQSEKLMKDFVSGACLGALISSFFFPFNVVKTHMQSQLGGSFPGFWKTFKVVHAERGGSFWKLFKGLHLNFTRSFISWGIINASYELLLHTFFHPSLR